MLILYSNIEPTYNTVMSCDVVYFIFLQLKERFDILPYLYDNFKKENMAELCKVLSESK